MHTEQILKNEDISYINQSQNNEYKKKYLKIVRKIKYRYSIMYFYTFNIILVLKLIPFKYELN